MKKIILALACLFPIAGIAQSGYTISGTIENLKQPAKAYIARLQGDSYKETDSTAVINGKFQFKGHVQDPEMVTLAVKLDGASTSGNQKDYLNFFLENSDIKISTPDSMIHAKITGSEVNREQEEQTAEIEPLITKITKIQDEFSAHSASSANKTVEERKQAGDSIRVYSAAIRNINMKFVESHHDSFMGLYTFNVFIMGSKFDAASTETMFHRFSSEMQSSKLGKQIQERIMIAKRGQAGVKVTDFTQNDIKGKPFTLSSLRGKYVLVDFWASWCAPCRAENPNVRKAYQQLKNKNLEIVSVSLDAAKPQWLAAIEKDEMPWINVCDFKGWKNDVAILYGVTSVPQNFLIDPNGLIIARDIRGDNLTEKLTALLK
ncbi:TlpA disulfide reductase family protein [Pedobacter sp. L105]|uniref:TlpA disulfide reductase family protein n=1 Tax=Pedobacter sp. L105 TaxID=1641871 RepID=UPI00131E371F|nr:TlpA disulfide reductase family protein [Pedobacter sp. L105]